MNNLRWASSRLPQRIRNAARIAAILTGYKPRVGPPEFKSALLVAPHPDDESIGVGGTIALATSAGASVGVIFATDGEALVNTGRPPDEIGRLRRDEAIRACQLLGAVDTTFLGLPDGLLATKVQDLAHALEASLRKTSPEVLLVPWFLDQHPDHLAINLAIEKLHVGRGLKIWAYEVWTPLIPNRYVDITSARELKEKAIMMHQTDTLLRVETVMGLNRFRAGQAIMKGTHAEAFVVTDLENYQSLIREVNKK